MFKRNDIANLKNILWAIEKINQSLSTVLNVEALVNNEEKFDSVIVKLMNIGESAYNISEKLKDKYTGVDWKGMYALRNIITQAYHEVDENIVWDIVVNELPTDYEAITKIINTIDETQI